MLKCEEIFNNKEDAKDILNYINIVFFEKIKDNLKYVNCINIVESTKEALDKNNNYNMATDKFVISVWEEINGKYYRS